MARREQELAGQGRGNRMQHDFGAAPAQIMDPPAVALPAAELFGERAARFRELVHRVPPLDEFLDLMAQVAMAQQRVLSGRQPAWRPAADAFEQALQYRMPPLGYEALLRDTDWRDDLAALMDALELRIGGNQRVLLDELRRLDAETLNALADQVLAAEPGWPSLRGMMPLVAAALQVTWVRLAQGLPRAPSRPLMEAKGLCPTCGAAPVASVIHAETWRHGVRYLHCGLCATEWHLERVKCSVCDEATQLTYLSLAPSDEKRAGGTSLLPVEAECCRHCGSYLKQIVRTQDGYADPVADDLGSLALDLMLAEQSDYARSGYNPLLIAAAD